MLTTCKSWPKLQWSTYICHTTPTRRDMFLHMFSKWCYISISTTRIVTFWQTWVCSGILCSIAVLGWRWQSVWSCSSPPSCPAVSWSAWSLCTECALLLGLWGLSPPTTIDNSRRKEAIHTSVHSCSLSGYRAMNVGDVYYMIWKTYCSHIPRHQQLIVCIIMCI